MPIPQNHSHRYFYHFTHIDNLPGLLETGFLAKGHADFPQDVRSIAAEGIQARRSRMEVTCGPGGVVHDYVPFYFGSLSPMLLGVIHKKNIDQFDLLYFEFPISLLEREEVVFADASANTDVPPNFFEDPEDLEKLNWGEIDSLKWKSASDELRHQRMAEVLFYGRVPLSLATNCVVWNKAAKEKVEALTKGFPDFPKLTFESQARRHFFTKFMIKEERGQSLVTGPKGVASMYGAVCEHFEKNIGANAASAPFAGPEALLQGLRDEFGCIDETAELVGLESENEVHKETVDIHTQEVVDTLLGFPEYDELNARQKCLVELAAHLHDIGKGPKERWLNKKTGVCVQKVDPDHPVRAMPMIARILTEEVQKIKLENAKLIAKLVCYHDLAGDVLGRERNEQQIAEVADSEEELKLLFLLGKADATTLGFWWDQEEADAIYARALKAIEAK